MVLSRAEQKIQKRNPKLGIVYHEMVDRLLVLSKGIPSVEEGTWFYRLFLRGRSREPKTMDKVREALQAAWWIEEEDILQELYYFTLLFKLWSPSTKNIRYIYPFVSLKLRDYLVYQEKIFRRGTKWREDYLQKQNSHRELEEMINLTTIFDKRKIDTEYFSLFDRYLMYLSYILELPRPEIVDTLLLDSRMINRDQVILKRKMEDYNAAT